MKTTHAIHSVLSKLGIPTAIALGMTSLAQAVPVTLTNGYVQTYSDGNGMQDQQFISPITAFNQTIVTDTSIAGWSSASATVVLFSDANGASIDVHSVGELLGSNGVRADTLTSFTFTIPAGSDPVPYSITGAFTGTTDGSGEAYRVYSRLNIVSYDETIWGILGNVTATWNGVLDGDETGLTGSNTGLLAPGTYSYGTSSAYWFGHQGGTTANYDFSSRLVLGTVSAQGVPDGGTTALMLVFGFLGIAGVNRKLHGA
ncbi:MAG: hypothetical protein ACI8T1_001067 [Verrucomicrobiales bacterium]|jgi:hypothetical protein